MGKRFGFVLLILAFFIAPAAGQTAQPMTDDQIRQAIIAESIRSYPGRCPCPYNSASNGSRCGKRSAWSKPGGRDPICYPNEIPKEMVDRFRKRNSIPPAN